MQPRLFVDGNNVMGSRADGWWRDRAGAARRIVAEIALLARVREGVWTIVFDGPAPRDTEPPPECLTVIHAGRRGRNSADDRIVALVDALPDRTTALVYTSDAGLRARVLAMGARVAGARALLKETAAVRGTMEPAARGGAPTPRRGGSS